MDPNGNIHQVPDQAAADYQKQMEALQRKLAAQGVAEGDLEKIPEAEVAKVKKMNRKARRKWYREQRRKKKPGTPRG